MDVEDFTAQPENKNAKRKIRYDLKIVLKFLHEVQKEERKLDTIPPEEETKRKFWFNLRTGFTYSVFTCWFAYISDSVYKGIVECSC